MQFTAKTVDEAIKNGLTELGITEEQAQIEIIEQPTKGLFGILKGKAIVEINEKKSWKRRWKNVRIRSKYYWNDGT